MKKIAILMVLAMVLSMGAAFAAAPGDATATGVVDQGSYAQVDGSTANVSGGNIYQSDVSATVSTARWAGIYGDVSGTIVLGDDTGNTATDIMYTWAGATGLVVYAVDGAVDWTSVSPATNATVTAQYTYLADAVAPNDNFAVTFAASHDLNSNLFESLGNPAVQTDDDSGAFWWTMALQDNAAKTVWAAEVVDGGHLTYDGATSAEFQMILPDSSEAEDTTPTTYDMWLELE